MRAILEHLFFCLELDRKDACADDKALYVETYLDGKRSYFRLVPVEVTAQEFNTAWDYNREQDGSK